jgi:hypothetical protein
MRSWSRRSRTGTRGWSSRATIRRSKPVYIFWLRDIEGTIKQRTLENYAYIVNTRIVPALAIPN